MRVSHSAWEFLKQYVFLFLQFLKFTYIHTQGFTERPNKLPWYPNDQIILLELSQQLQHVHTILSNKHLVGISYPFTLGLGMYKLQTSQCARNLEKELAKYHFQLHTPHPQMDPYGHVRKVLGPKYTHLHHVEDLWENFQNDKEVCIRHYMRMTTYFVRRVQLFPITNQVEEDEGTIMDPLYNVVANLPLPTIDWDE